MQPHTSRSGVVSSAPYASPNARMIEAAAGGDEAAWNRLVERYSNLLWAIVRAHRLSHGDAADVVQTTWLRLVERLPEIRNPDSVGSWLATTTRRECLKTLRGTSRCQPSDLIDQYVEPDRTGADERLLRDERDAGLWKAFGRLPESDQALLRLLTSEPAPSYAEVSAALGMPVGSIGPTRGRALERLRRELARTGALHMAQEG